MDAQETSVHEKRREGSSTASTEDGTPTPDSTNSKSVESDSKSQVAEKADSKKTAKEKCAKKQKTKPKKSKKTVTVEIGSSDSDSSSSSCSSSSSSSSSDSESSDSESESDVESKKKKKKAKKRADAAKSKKKQPAKPPKKAKKGSKATAFSSSGSDSSLDSSTDSDSLYDSGDEDPHGQLRTNPDLAQLYLAQQQQQQRTNALAGLGGYAAGGPAYGGGHTIPVYDNRLNLIPPIDRRPRKMPPPGRALGGHHHHALGGGAPVLDQLNNLKHQQQKLKGLAQGAHGSGKKAKVQRLEYKRVDQVWDSSIHNYKLQDTAETSPDTQYDEFLFHVRRTFDWEGKYKTTIVDIKSKLLRDALRDVMGNIKGVSLVEETPKLDPNMLFLYLEDLRAHLKQLKKMKAVGGDKSERKKEQKRIDGKYQQLKVLIKYIDKDYAHIKKSLYPMLENGLITFDLLWALWKPNTLAFTSTYGSLDDPRVFKVEMSEKHFNILKGDFYYIEGKYFEFDGKQFGFGQMSEEIAEFRGARKITSLNCYPLQYHKNEAKLRAELIERGKKFVALSGVHYKSHDGMAYYKKKKAVVKVNINGRIMVDAAIHRRINPNYPVSLVRPKDNDLLSGDDDSSDDECGDSETGRLVTTASQSDEQAGERGKYVTKVVTDENGDVHAVRVHKDEIEDGKKEELDAVNDGEEDKKAGPGDKASKTVPEYSDEEYLIASPVVLGFAFAEKLWLEFTVSGVKDIQWNDSAYDSLVLEPKTKDIVRVLVESHKYHAAESIDDVIQGKGKGLVAVLHGPPGTGKTLTAEGISELLKCPLYMVSAGELGTDSRYLETELQKILDICHAWGAILLLDEADVFLEKRNMHDIHRNALVSIFLRQLEYFQGILFLTTNRVETFDDAFQSRIHIALRYDDLDHRAKKAIFKIFIERVRVLEKIDLMPFTEEDYNTLAKHPLNGRQIKNTVRTAQALAVNKREPLSMKHIRQVLDVQMNFDRDLKGGTGYQDAMRSYF